MKRSDLPARLREGLPPSTAPAKRSKYRNKPTVVDGERFDSLREAKRWAWLRLLEQRGAITGLKRQVRYRLEVNGQHICDYIADFDYTHVQIGGGAWNAVVEDCKGFRTQVYKLKKKLMLACHGITIVET